MGFLTKNAGTITLVLVAILLYSQAQKSGGFGSLFKGTTPAATN